MVRLFKILIIVFFICASPSVLSHSFYAKNTETKMVACQACWSLYCCNRFPSDYKVDNACVDACLDYEHNLSECQKACSN